MPIRVVALPRILLVALLLGLCRTAGAQQVQVRIITSMGEILVAVDARHAPRTAANFLRYVDAHLYDGGQFHRTVTAANQPGNPIKIQVIQGGMDPARQAQEFAPIALERTLVTGLKHRSGTLSMARDGPDSATSDFFICVADEPSLDYGGKRNPDGQGFAAFGQVIHGMEVVRRIQGSKADGQRLTPSIEIRAIQRVVPP